MEVNYGAINAIKKISFDVNEGEVIALIGANGAGKTTTLHTITGLLKAKSGSVKFEGRELTKMPPHKIVKMGMAHVPEGRRIFQQLSVYKNLDLGAYSRSDRKEYAENLEMVYEKFPRLKERKTRLRVLCRAASSRCLQWAGTYVKPEDHSYGRTVNGAFAFVCRRSF